MNLGDNIKQNNELFVFRIFENIINILHKLRNIDKNTFNLDDINYNDNSISLI